MRLEGREALDCHTTGLLTELPHKNGDTFPQAGPGTSAQRLQEFLTNMPWDAEDLNRQQVQQMVAEAARGDGGLVFDDTGFPAQGQCLGWGRAAVFGHPGQGGQLPGDGDLLSLRSSCYLAGGG